MRAVTRRSVHLFSAAAVAVCVSTPAAIAQRPAARSGIQQRGEPALRVAPIVLAVETPGSNPDYPAWISEKTITDPEKLSLRWRPPTAAIATAQWQLAASPFPADGSLAEPAGLLTSGSAGASSGANKDHYFLLDLKPHLPASAPAAPKKYYVRVVGLDGDGKAVRASNPVTLTYEQPGSWGTTFAFPTIAAVQGTVFANKEQKKTATVPIAMIGHTIRITGSDLVEHKDTLKIQFVSNGAVAAVTTPVNGSVVPVGGGQGQLRAMTPLTLDEGNYYVRIEVNGSATSNTMPVYVGPERMDAALFQVLNARNVPAAGGAFVTRNGMKGIGAAGSRVHGGPSDVTIDDRWHIGSDTKAMTATLVGIFADRGAIGFDTKIVDVFPELASTMKGSLKNVTVRMLMAHRAGLNGGGYSGYEAGLLNGEGLSRTGQRYQYVKMLLHTNPSTTPNTTYTYSNRGFILVGAMLERRTGKSWEQLMQDELFTPLGMTTAGFGAPGAPDAATQPRGHQDGAAGRTSAYVDNPPAAGPAGNVHLSLADWARFIRLHLNGREGKVTLSAASLTALHTPYPSMDDNKYGGGWGINQAKGILSHDGSNTWWYARAVVDLKNGHAVLAAVNLGDSGFNGASASKACADIVAWLRKRYLD